MFRCLLLSVFNILLCLIPVNLHAQMNVSGIAITADESELNNRQGIVELRGNVQVIYNGYFLNCDKATIYRKTKRVVAEGHVILQSPTTYSESRKVDFNFNTEKGVFYDGFIQSGKVVFEGDTIEKTGKDQYLATNGRYTACSTCPPAWSFTGSKIKAELGGYADISYPVLRVLDFPIFVLPKILVPLKSKRQSGFLVPSMRFGGSNGLTISTHYFWAISRNTDLTFSLTKYETRGWKGLGQYRYVLSEDSFGSMSGAYIYDQAFQNCVQGCDTGDPGTVESKENRGFFAYGHYYVLPGKMVQRAQLYWISDLRYLRDFSDEIEGEHGRAALENKVSLTKTTEHQHISGEVGFYRNLLAEDAFSDNDEAVHRLPDLNYNLVEQRLFDTNLLFRIDADYTNFARNSFGYDDICSRNPTLVGKNASYECDDRAPLASISSPNPDPLDDEQVRVDSLRDGQFDPDRDLLRTGQRLNIAPQLSYPIPIGNIFSFVPSLTYRETQYRFNAQSDLYSQTAARRYLQVDASLKTLFSRVFGDYSVDSPALKHEIEPELLYSSRPWVRRPNHVFFGDFASQNFSRTQEKLTDEDLFGDDDKLFAKNKVQFDYEDRLFQKNLLSFSVANRLVRKRWEGGRPVYKSIASLTLTQSYDFEENAGNTSQPWSNIDALFDVRLDNLIVYAAATYYPYVGATNSTSRVRVLANSSNFFEVGYTQTFTIDDNNNFEFDKRTEIVTTSLGFNHKYLQLVGTIDYNNVNFNVQRWKYTTTLKPPGECWSIQFTHWLNSGKDDPEFDFNFSFDFSGET